MEDIDRQLSLERRSIEEGVNKYRVQLHENGLANMPPGIILVNAAVDKMAAAVREFREAQKGRGLDLKPMLEGLTDIEVAWITAKKAIEAILFPIPVTRLANEIADVVLHQREYNRFREECPQFLKKVESNLRTSHIRHRRNVIFRAKRLAGIQDLEYTTEKKTRLGSKLLDLFIESTGIVQLTRGYRGQLFITGHPDTKEWVEIANKNFEIRNPLYLPMIAPPSPWFCPYGGGYYSNHASLNHPLIKTSPKNLQEIENVDMPLIYRAVNGLQNTKWRINKRILEVMQELWDRGGDIAKLPSSEDRELPVQPWFDDDEFQYLKENEPARIKAWKREAAVVYEKNAKEVSKRIATRFKLQIANQLKDEPRLYLCWCLDWRGRYYPIQNFINPQVDDSGKALLEFAEGHELGDRGAYWLKIHLADAYGYDKVSFEDRIKWVKEHEREILDSASNPIDGYRFWLDADDPFSFLAACFEYQGYKRDGNRFISHLPISVDATASGLQHFAAMGRDETGGKAVNLVPGNKPADIYQTVANKLIELVNDDAVNGKVHTKKRIYKTKEGPKVTTITVDERAMAKLWQGKIDRQLVKRPVMTHPYSVTAFGVKEQLMDELNKRDQPKKKYLDTEDYLYPCIYLAGKLEQAIGQVVESANVIRDWLKSIAAVFNEAGLPIRWTTPSGFSVIQDYQRWAKKRVETFWGKIVTKRIMLDTRKKSAKLNTTKQVSAISPNFVHSMDASLMTLVINRCLDAGITDLSMVHDSFGVHACNMDKLNAIIREAFVDMYSQNVLEDFRNQVVKQLPEKYHDKIPPVPEPGTLDLSQVKQSRYFCH